MSGLLVRSHMSEGSKALRFRIVHNNSKGCRTNAASRNPRNRIGVGRQVMGDDLKVDFSRGLLELRERKRPLHFEQTCHRPSPSEMSVDPRRKNTPGSQQV